MSKVYCRYCGQQIDENASFCTYCGKALEHEEDAHWLVNSYYYRGLAKMKLLNLAGVYKDLEHAKELGNEKAEDERIKLMHHHWISARTEHLRFCQKLLIFKSQWAA